MKVSEKLFIGPAQSEWWKFKLGSKVVELRFRYPRLSLIPKFDEYIVSWALDKTIGSRDVEVM